jgi:hypothetical protein
MQSWLDQHSSLVWIIGPLWFVFGWLLVMFVLSYIGGWSTLAKRYRVRSEYAGPRWPRQSGKMRWGANYSGCLTLGASPEGLYLAMMWLFSFRHPPLLIPWQQIEVTREKVWWWEFVRFRLGREEGIPLRVRAKIGSNLMAEAGTNLPVETTG